MKNKITKQKIEKYYNLTNKALKIVKQNISQPTKAKEIIEMVSCYLSDAKHFQKNKDYVNAFACLNYAHGWLDAGARLKVFNVTDTELFTI